MENEHRSLPNVAVLMATYNGERYLHEQIDSILNQEKVNIFLYIRDDRSSDRTVDIINEYSRRTGKVFLLDTYPEQLYVTKNFYSIVRDIDLENIDYVSYCDQDDIWLSNKLAMAAWEINAHNVDCYASNLLMGDANGKIIQRSSFFSKLMRYILNSKSNKQLPFDHYFEAASAGCTLVLNKKAAVYFQNRIRKLYDRIPFNASHDWSTYAITRLGALKWYIDKNAYIIYRQHSANAYGANVGLSGVSKLIDLFTSGWYRNHILMIEDLYNEGDSHPAFIENIRQYRVSAFTSRVGVAFTICKYRRKYIHRIAFFCLIVFGYFK